MRFAWIIIALAIFILGFATADGKVELGPVTPQVVNAAPAQPFTCDAGVRGVMIYVDDTDDTAEAFICFCGVDADDSTYIWLRAGDSTQDCF